MIRGALYESLSLNYGAGMTNSNPDARFSSATTGAARPVGVNRSEGWWIIALAVALFVAHAFLFQALAFEWGGILRFAVLALLIVSTTWLGLQRRSSEGVHPRHHTTTLLLAGAWAMLVAVGAGWFWVAQGQGQDVAWPITTAVSALAFAPLAVVGWRLVRAGSR